MTAVLKAPLPEPTLEQLLMAYRHLARPGWPHSLDAALAHHAYSVALRALACGLNRPSFAQTHSRSPTLLNGPVPPTPPPMQTRKPGSIARTGPAPLSAWPATTQAGPHRRTTTATTTAGRFDAKKAAANDKD